ncbi:hypothetical protein DW017_10790 [Ruminococcus sp. AF37-3AC]|nr:hypothetical protein [Ruminococcus sp. AF37-3AC]RGF39262.1 hypothetical protein DW017_10790 [Ruminococcus sp. AF37-3AC]
MLVIINCILALIFLFVLDEVKSSQNIVNFKDNRDLQGGFYKASKIKADDCEIIYTKDTPHIDIIVKSADEKATENPLTFEPLLSLRISGTGEKYKIYIPEGSITTDFQVDME